MWEKPEEPLPAAAAAASAATVGEARVLSLFIALRRKLVTAAAAATRTGSVVSGVTCRELRYQLWHVASIVGIIHWGGYMMGHV